MNQAERYEKKEGYESGDFIQGLVRQWRVFTTIVLGVFVVGIAFIFLTPKVYRIDSLIEIGTFPDSTGTVQPLESPQQLIEKITNGNYTVLAKKKLGIADKQFPEVDAENPENTNLVQVSVYSSYPEIAQTILTEINTVILADHQKKFNSKVELYTASVKALEGELRFMGSGTPLAVVFSNQKMALATAEPTVLVKEPTISILPVNQGPLVTLLIALFIGVIVGVFVSLSREWWLQVKKSTT